LPQGNDDGKSADIMVRIPRALQARYEKLQKKDSWRSFPAFVREAVRASLEKQELIDRELY
jgi:Arc/MetJ-type ribon-helix-helix transcriptional regulator